MLSMRHSSELASRAGCRHRMCRADTIRSIPARPSMAITHGSRRGRASGRHGAGSRHVGDAAPSCRWSAINSQPSQTLVPCAAFADAVHPVVPVAGSDQRHSVTRRSARWPDRDHGAVLEQGCGLVRNVRLEEIVMRPRLERQVPARNGTSLIQDRPRRPCTLDIPRDAIAQPDPIVRDARPHALAGMRQPPVLHVAFGELPAGGAQQVARASCPGRANVRAMPSCNWSRKP